MGTPFVITTNILFNLKNVKKNFGSGCNFGLYLFIFLNIFLIMLLPWHNFTITLDTMCFIEKYKDENIIKLFELQSKNFRSIIKTDVVDTELSDSSKEKSKDVPEDLGVGRIGHSRTDHAVTGDGDDLLFENLMKIVFPETKGEPPTTQKTRDVMALTTHKQKDREIFVTKDKAICRAKEKLEEQYGIKVMSPTECGEYVVEQNKK